MPSRQSPRSDLLEAVEDELTLLRARNLALEAQVAAQTSELAALSRDHEAILDSASERRVPSELDGQLRHAHDMEARARLAGSMAHEFNNLLTPLLGNLSLLGARLQDDGTNLLLIEDMVDAANRAAVLVRQLLADATGRVPPAPTPVRGQVAVTNSQGCVLIVDDEQLVRDVGARLLEAVGFDVMLATGGHHALEVYQREHARIDAVLLDLSMPDMTGREVLRQLLAFDPAVRVVLWSGYSDGQDFESAESLGAKGFLAKPFSVGELTDVLRRVLATP